MRTTLPLAVPVSGPLYEGHFPGRPILPGVGLLDLSIRALAAEGAAPELREITSLRLRKLVGPGDALEIAVKAYDADGAIRFEVRRAGECVAVAGLILGSPEAGAPIAGVPCGSGHVRVHGAPPLDRLLPHRPPMRFITGVDSEMEEGLVCLAQIPARCAFAENGSAPGLVAVEMAAQTAAVFEALRRGREQENAGPRIGYLVGARDVKLSRGRLQAERPLRAVIRQTAMAPPLSTYAFAVEDGELVVASGTLSTWLTATAA